ncbi:WLM-domain-containing protein [Jaminaea rosea]|uniref:WLM-domain-containing protein n=1 Tax=Jaminaea rosea TaxID=1569628 RepID=A0A316UUG9_9BASI|nr:WLM-domain-containing protein [Jaminaea rosea]PWN28882.1 WLM-domain-containing protein [Jaminaea rosea]
MVHLRLNDGDTARNEYINFVSALDRHANKDDALRRLHQLAAIFKPIMKRHGLRVNHLVEYEPNPEFAGRNWNAGENIEMVLRDHSGLFLPFGMICYVFAHELAHNFHMNHSSKHTQLTKDFNEERKDLQSKGYLGDGFWSAGKRLDDESWVAGESSVTNAELPSNLCGGAWKRRGAAARKRRTKRTGEGTTKRRKKGVPSLRTGAQTSANTERVAGKTRRYMDLPGEGSRVDGRNDLPKASAKSDSYKSDPNSTFRKQANTNAARDARAAAAMRRMAALQVEQKGHSGPKDEGKAKAETDEDGYHTQEEDDGSCTESETESETGSDREEELLYDSSDEQPRDGVCGTDASSSSTSTSAQDPPASRTETDAQRKRRMEEFRRSDGGRNERQARDEWRDIVRATQGMRVSKPGVKTEIRPARIAAGGSTTSSASSSSGQQRAATTGGGTGGSKAVASRVEDDDDDDIVFVSSSKKA